jgi:hypothetical protein
MTKMRWLAVGVLVGMALGAAAMNIAFVRTFERIPMGAEAYNWYLNLVD